MKFRTHYSLEENGYLCPFSSFFIYSATNPNPFIIFTARCGVLFRTGIQKHTKDKDMDSHSFLAFDLGATSGRAVVGTLADGKFTMEEIEKDSAAAR